MHINGDEKMESDADSSNEITNNIIEGTFHSACFRGV
jgi:hypothetical protein